MADIDVTTLPSATPTTADHFMMIADSDSSLNDATIGDIIALAPSPEVSILSPAGSTLTLSPCPVTYAFGEKAELTLTVTATSQYHFSFTCPSGAATLLTINGITGTAGDTPAAGKTYEVDVWNGIALFMEVVVVSP